MKIPKRIIHRISRIIKDTSVLYSQALPDTQRHLLPQVLLGLLSSGSVYASDVARRMGGASIGAKGQRFRDLYIIPSYHMTTSLRLIYRGSQSL